MKKSLVEQVNLMTASGALRLFSFNKATREIAKMIEIRNLILYGGADILALLAGGQSSYNLRTMYIEFENLADPSDPITPPTFGRADGVAYYNGLVSSPNRDFIRVALSVSPAFSTSGVDYVNNIATFFGQSSGTVGFHGKSFGESSNSAIFGAALVASPDPEDQSKDIVFSRAYSGIDKILKQAGFEIGVTWSIRLN